MEYTIPNNLLSTNNYKTVKGEKFGYTTYIMYLAPHTQNSKGKNLCSHASAGCAKACLFNSGNARFTRVQQGKVNKTEYFLAERKNFMEQLFNEITKIVANHEAVEGEARYNANGKVIRYKKFAIRLNGTSDLPFEHLRYKNKDNKNIFELFPEVQFYDYTKIPSRFEKVLPSNYHLTFSRSEINHNDTISLLNRGFNVAIVFQTVPETYKGFKVINGDESDLRFLDEENIIVGLKYKYMTNQGEGANHNHIENNDFIINDKQLQAEAEKILSEVA